MKITDEAARNIAIVVSVIALLLMCWFFVWPGSVWGAATQYPIAFGGDYDSVRIYWWEKSGTDWDLEDSMKISTFPITDSIALDDAKDYKIVYWYWEGTDQLPAGEFIKFTAGPATISSADKEEIAGIVEDTLSVHHGAGSWLTGGGGTASDTLIMYALDTSGTDATVQDVKITIYNPSGEKVITGIYTDAYGKHQIALDPANGYTAIFRHTGHIFPSFSFDVAGDDDSLPVPGYDIELQASPDPNLCRVQGYVYIPTGGTTEKIKVTFTIIGEAVHNDCDGTAFIAEPVIVWTSTHADSLGFFYADLVPSGCLLKGTDSLQYKITTELSGVKGREDLYWVPQEESYEIVW